MDQIKTKKEISDIDSFVEAIKEIGGVAAIFDKEKIEKNYGGRLSEALTDLFDIIRNLRFKKLSVIFTEKGEESRKMSWYSVDSGRIVANLNFDPGTPAFKKDIQAKAEEAQRIEENL